MDLKLCNGVRKIAPRSGSGFGLGLALAIFLEPYLMNVLHKQKSCTATLQNCKIFYSYIRYSTRKQPSDVL